VIAAIEECNEYITAGNREKDIPITKRWIDNEENGLTIVQAQSAYDRYRERSQLVKNVMSI
jgi:hypothetical protein